MWRISDEQTRTKHRIVAANQDEEMGWCVDVWLKQRENDVKQNKPNLVKNKLAN